MAALRGRPPTRGGHDRGNEDGIRPVSAEDAEARARRGAAERDLLRDIAVGSLAGLIAGLVIGGVGGRVVMRLAALLAPEAVGRFTENGFRIGTITLQGSLGLILFGGLAGGAFVAAVWVVARPWLPRTLGWRVLASVPLGLAMTGFGLISAGNADFRILGFDPAVVAVLVGLIAVGGPFLALVDAALERWLPRPGPGRRSAPASTWRSSSWACSWPASSWHPATSGRRSRWPGWR